MKRILVTENQLRLILMKENMGYPLNLKTGSEQPDNFTTDEIAVNNTDKDAPSDVTIGDAIKRSKEGWFGMNRYPAMHRLPEGKELDNAQNSGFGLKNDQFISDVAKNNKGKMSTNIAAEINSNTRGSRNNTNQVRASRMEKYKETNPELFQKNGGEKMLNVLKNQTTKQSNAHASEHANDNKAKNAATDGFGRSENGAFYFK